MNAFGSKYWLGLPGMSFPVKAGFQEGRMGFRLSPLFVGLNPNCGVNGKPDCRVSTPLSVQPPASFLWQAADAAEKLLARSEGKLVARVDDRDVAGVGVGGAPVQLRVSGVHDEPRSIGSHAAVQRGAVIQALRPGVSARGSASPG